MKLISDDGCDVFVCEVCRASQEYDFYKLMDERLVKIDKAKIVKGVYKRSYGVEQQDRINTAVYKLKNEKVLSYERVFGNRWYSNPSDLRVENHHNPVSIDYDFINDFSYPGYRIHIANAKFTNHEQTEECLNAIQKLNFNHVRVNNMGGESSMYVDVILPLMYEQKEVITPKDLCDNSLLKFGLGDTVNIVNAKGVILHTGTATTFNDKSVRVVFNNGTFKSVAYSRVVKSKTQPPKIEQSLSCVPDPTIEENLKAVLDYDHIGTYDLKEITTKRFDEYNKKFITEKVKAIKCPNCDTDTNVKRCCINCKQTFIIIAEKIDKALVMLGPKPVPNTVCLKEARCCDNCKNFTFGYGRQGKRQTGYCDKTRQCVKSYNTCDRWFPIDGPSYSSNMKGSITNLGCGVNRYKDKNNEELDYTADMHAENKNKFDKMKMKYTLGYNVFMEKLKEKYGF